MARFDRNLRRLWTGRLEELYTSAVSNLLEIAVQSGGMDSDVASSMVT